MDVIKIDKSFDNLLKSLLLITFVYIMSHLTSFGMEILVSEKIKQLFNVTITRILRYDIDFYRNYSSNHINQLWLYMNTIESLIEKCIIDAPKHFIFTFYYAYLIYMLSFKIMIILIIVIFILLILTHPLYKLKLYYQKMKLKNDIDTKNTFLEIISNIELVKINNKQEYEIKKILNIYNNYYVFKIKNSSVSTLIEFINVIINNNLVILITFGALYYNSNDILYLAFSFKNFYNGLIELKDIGHSCKKNYSKLKYIYEIISYPNIENLHLTYNFKNNNIFDKIIFKNISFKYPGSINFIFENKNFSFEKNKINILTGKNGFGKSTLVKLLLKMYEPLSGNIYFYGENIKNISTYDIRSKINYVLQDPLIFNDTIIYNVKYGNEISQNKINKKASRLGISDWLNLNQNKKTGYNGKECSGGEKKRIQLLNTLCKKHEIVIFDEPSNHLDDETIKHFIELLNLFKIKSKITIIIITHDSRLLKLSENLIIL